MRTTILSLSLILSLSYATSAITIPSGASWTQPSGAYLCSGEITVSSGGIFTAASSDDVCVTPNGGGDVSLPVTISFFDAVSDENNGSVLVTWVTESETYNLGFIIERSNISDGLWSEIASYITCAELQGQGSVTRRTEYSYVDKTVEARQTYDYRLADVNYAGVKAYFSQYAVGVEVPEILPREFCLDQNYPNPFNPSTVIRYGLPEQSDVILVIYDLRGRIISTMEAGRQEAGYYNFTWNGIDDQGRAVSTGIYFARLQAGSNARVIKMAFVK